MAIIDFSPQSLNIDLDEIGKGIKVFIPNVLGDFSTTEHSVHIASKIFQQRIFLKSQLNGTVRTPYPPPPGINLEVREHDRFRMQTVSAAQQCSGARQ